MDTRYLYPKNDSEFPRLTLNNYFEWKNAVTMVLQFHRVFYLLETPFCRSDFAISAPVALTKENQAEIEMKTRYLADMDQATAIIRNSISPKIREQFAEYKDPKLLWEAIKTKLVTKREGGSYLDHKFFSYRWKPGSTLAAHIALLNDIIDLFTESGRTLSDDDKQDVLIRHLPDKYDNLIAASIIVNPTYETLCEALLKAELELQLRDSTETNVEPLKSNSSRPSTNKSSSSFSSFGFPHHFVCGVCRKKGHTARVCPKAKHNSNGNMD